MNHKQKLGYTLLGAGIMAVGITIGQWVTPNIEAQNNSVFDKITCRELEVVDAKGNKAIVLGNDEKGSIIILVDETQEAGIVLGTSKKIGNYLRISNPTGNGIVLGTSKKMGNHLRISNPTGKSGKSAIELTANKDASNSIRINDKAGNIALGMIALDDDMTINGLHIYDKTGKQSMSISCIGGGEGSHSGIGINYAGVNRIMLAASESGGNIVIHDKKEKVEWSAP